MDRRDRRKLEGVEADIQRDVTTALNKIKHGAENRKHVQLTPQEAFVIYLALAAGPNGLAPDADATT